MVRVKLIKAISELDRKSRFYGVRITWFHWTHNLRVYLGLNPERHWLPVLRSYPYTISDSLAERKAEGKP